jgi:N-acetylmuramic acid 6-phosphate etherase
MSMPEQSPMPPDRSRVLTEQRNPRSMRLHRMTTAEIVQIIQEEDRTIADAMARARTAIVKLIEHAEPGFLAGGRLIYIGAGTSGRLGVLDASEAPPTFRVQPGRVVGIIAGGDASLRRSSESREDDSHGAFAELATLKLDHRDTVIGISAGGTTPYVLGALESVKSTPSPPTSAWLVCTPVPKPGYVDHLIVIETGPEILTGSTRMKAGTATKLALNTISTTLMVRAGKVYENLMVDLRATNDKLRDRAARIISTLCGLDRQAALNLLERANGVVKTAIVMHRLNTARDHAEEYLRQTDGYLPGVLENQ